MTTDDDLDALFTALSERTGLPRPTAAEALAALDLARVVAHGSVRKGAPLACYAAGLALAASTDPEERATRLRQLVHEVDALVAEGRGG